MATFWMSKSGMAGMTQTQFVHAWTSSLMRHLHRRLSGYWRDFPDSKPLIHGDENLPDAEWPLPSTEALEYLDKAAILLSKRGVDATAGDLDRRLEHILKASDELRASYVTIEGRLVEWVGLFLPEARFERDRTGLAKK